MTRAHARSGLGAAGPEPWDEHAAPASGRRQVTVALQARRDHHAAIEMGRLIADATDAPLHALFSWSTELPAHEVPRLARLDPGMLHGLVLDVTVGDAVECAATAARSRDNAFVVVTAEDAIPSPRDPLGVGLPVSRALAEAAAGVVVMRPGVGAPRALRRILLPLDGAPSTAEGIRPVGDLAARAGALLDIVVVGEAGSPHPHALERGSLPPPQYVDQPHHEWAAFSSEFLQRFVQAIGHCPAEVQTRLFVAAGDPGEQICRYARELDTDLVVLVWHGHLEGDHGAVFSGVLRAATKPVLVLKR